MKAPKAPRLDERRRAQFAAELQDRARAWIPEWGLADAERDFGRALLDVAARFSSEVAERLDGAGEKMRRGFLDWLAVRGQAARPARMPVVFKLADTAVEGVRAAAPVQLQADADGTQVVFETERDVRVIPGQLDVVVGVDADKDAFYLPPPGLNDLTPLKSLPTEWQLKSFAAAGVITFQLEPEGGLVPGTVIEASAEQYRIVKADKNLVTIDRPLVSGLEGGSRVIKVTTFAPFDGHSHNQQQHALYFGDSELLNIKQEAKIEVVGASTLREGYTWQYWGKAEKSDEVGWQQLDLDNDRQKDVSDAVALKKPKGAIESREIQGKNSRWIRAYRKTVGESQLPFNNDKVELRINPSGCKPSPCELLSKLESPFADAMSNTTPVVIGGLFYPLGREPRQFDTFYLGSEEAFSKATSKVQLCFEMADENFALLTSLRSGATIETIVGVAADGRLHLLTFNEGTGRLNRSPNSDPLRPPSPGRDGVPTLDPPVPLDSQPNYRMPTWTSGSDICIAAPAKDSVWLWRENRSPTRSGWEPLGMIGPVTNSESPIEGLVYLGDGGAGQLFALRESKLFVHDLNSSDAGWKEIRTEAAANDIPLTHIAPVYVESENVVTGKIDEGLVAISTTGDLYGVSINLSELRATCKELISNVSPDVAPAAVRRTNRRLVAVAVGNGLNPRKIHGFLSEAGTFDKDDEVEAIVEWPTIVGGAIDVNLTSAQLTFAFCAQSDFQETGLYSWNPFDSVNPTGMHRTTIPSQVGIPTGSPTLLPKHVIVPISSQVIVASFDPTGRRFREEELLTGIVADVAEDRLRVGDQLAIPKRGTSRPELATVNEAGKERGGQTLYEFEFESKKGNFFVYPVNALALEALVDPDDLHAITLLEDEGTVSDGSTVLIKTDKDEPSLYKVVDFNDGSLIAILDRELDVLDPSEPPARVDFKAPERGRGNLRPILRLDPDTSGDWDAALLDRTRLHFPSGTPSFQKGVAFDLVGRLPKVVALTEHWDILPTHSAGNKVRFLVDASVGEWSVQLGDTSTNPELSWEYWNGTGWWKLLNVTDETRNFKRTGVVSFEIPPDLEPTDWSGKTNFWVRARLIGGDYGREVVSVNIEGTKQTVTRSTEGIRPPVVLKLSISYGFCHAVLPQFVLAEDSGTTRDQSDANRTPGAIVEAFVPLALTLGRLDKDSAPIATEPPSPACPPKCDCATLDVTKQSIRSDADGNAAAPSTRLKGRELYIGLHATPSEAPVNVLLLVKEKDHSRFAPMSIEAFIADRFVPVVADDKTRALGESGLLSMTFAIPPTPSELFGRTLAWLRLKPKKISEGTWLPEVRGAYLNGAWASATETLTRELLGSSNGEPHLIVRVARPPVLHQTLVLRVREPLGEEERESLLKNDDKSVQSDVEGLPGDWVLWEQVVDPDDEPSSARVYSLDENTGDIRFGDGIHGKIPPIGRDAIVAFSYSRTEPDPAGGEKVPGNSIAPRTELNLVSPIETVETVTAADQAAGGAPPESDDRVLRFGFARLRHRERAITAEDIEDLTLQSSPDIVQAHAFVRRGYIRLVVVMRGTNPQPNAAQIRELRRLLLASAPVSLSAPGALRIEPPVIRRLRIDLGLQVETLDNAGALTDFVKQQLAAFFDTATGGVDKDGWPLGANPNEADIALTLIDAPFLESITDVDLREITADGQVLPSLDKVKANEIVMLADDPVRIQFETAEVMV